MELSKHLNVTMYGCCIQRATVLPGTKSNPEVLAPWADKIYTEESYPMCWGATEKEEAEKIALERIEAEHRQTKAPGILKDMSTEVFCTSYGRALRNQDIYQIGALPDTKKLVKLEANRRKLRFDDSLVRKEKIRIGVSECQLYASWGLPNSQNKSVGQWGVHVQYVYGDGTYVYTENGRVTSWQN